METPSRKARSMMVRCSSKSNLVRKPREPRAKERTGGTMRWKSQLAYSTVPSPPSWFVVSAE